MFIPSQGFRHAATLLLTNGARGIPAGAAPETIRAALERLAHDLVALADDTRAPAEASDWLIAELNTTIDRLPQSFDRADAKSAGAAVLARVASRTPGIEPRDLFLIYVPEDRLPVAAPLAVELTKRRVSVAFADFEVATAQQFDRSRRSRPRTPSGWGRALHPRLRTHAIAACQLRQRPNRGFCGTPKARVPCPSSRRGSVG